MGVAGLARSEGFAPCADAAGFPALEDSQCVVAHAAALSEAGDVQFTTVDGGAHMLPFVAAVYFVEVASAFVAGGRPPGRCESGAP